MPRKIQLIVECCVLRPGNVHSTDGWSALLEPVIARYRGSVKRLYFRGDAAFGNPEMYEYLEAEGVGYAIRLPASRVLQDEIGYLLKRLVGRPPHQVQRYYASFSYQAQSWNRSRHIVAKVEWHSGELYPRVGFIVSNLARSAEGIVAFYKSLCSIGTGSKARPASAIARSPTSTRGFWVEADRTYSDSNCRFVLVMAARSIGSSFTGGQLLKRRIA
jgi:hypothetical protein